MRRIISLIFISAIAIVSCNNKSIMETKKNKTLTANYPGPHAIIYKTKNYYNNLVPIIMSDDKTEIVSYPGIKDIYYKGKLALPTELNNGFLLDNRGINKNTAFIKYTYQQYSKLPETPKMEILLKSIIDKDPFIEMYDCGQKNIYQDIIKELNNIIDENMLGTLKKLK